VRLLLELLCVAAVLQAVLVITAKNPVSSVLFLVTVFLSAAGALALLGAPFIGLIYVIVYVGAIAVLFLFVVLMLNLRVEELMDVGPAYRKSLPLAFVLSLTLLWEAAAILSVESHGTISPLALLNGLNGLSTVGASPALALDTGLPLLDASLAKTAPLLQVEALGMLLYGPAALWLVVAGLIFMLAMFGPITLSLSERSARLTH
jgi:NADH-ubiquinone oxidoreductase chain 6